MPKKFNEPLSENCFIFPLPNNYEGFKFKMVFNYGISFKKLRTRNYEHFGTISLDPNQQKSYFVKSQGHPSISDRFDFNSGIHSPLALIESKIKEQFLMHNKNTKFELIESEPEFELMSESCVRKTIHNQSENTILHADFFQILTKYQVRIKFLNWSIILEQDENLIAHFSHIDAYQPFQQFISRESYAEIIKWIHKFHPNINPSTMIHTTIAFLQPFYITKKRICDISPPSRIEHYHQKMKQENDRAIRNETKEFLKIEIQRIIRIINQKLKKTSTE